MATRNTGQHPAGRGASSTRLEKSRKLAQKRRETYKDLMTGVVESLPFSREVLSQLDYNSRLRLALCYLKMKSLLKQGVVGGGGGGGLKMIEASPESEAVDLQPGVLQQLLVEAMDGFLTVVLSDGNIIYLSDSIHKHLGLFQSEHMGSSLYDLVLEDDHSCVKQSLASAEARAHTRLGTTRVSVPCSFFCRMKCSRNKVANTQSMSPGFKVVHTSGHFRLNNSEAFLVALVKPVTPPSILEIRIEGNMFVTHYALDMKCIFFDGRLPHLMGYEKADLTNKLVFDLHHHDDTEATLECSKGIQARGEGMSGYYRMLTKHGQFVWLQTRATMMFDSHTGNPSYIVCMNFVINKDKGKKSLEGRKALPSPPAPEDTIVSEENSKAHDPFPIPREDGKDANPLNEGGIVSSSSSSSSAAATVGGVAAPVPDVKIEEMIPPTLGGAPPPNNDVNEEPSSTTDNSALVAPPGRGEVSSGGGNGEAECVPDSTTITTATSTSGNRKTTDPDTSSYSRGQRSTHPSTSDSTGLHSTPRLSNKVFSGGNVSSGSIPMQSYSHSTPESESPAIYQDPIITEIMTKPRPQEFQPHPPPPPPRPQAQQQTPVYHGNQQQQQPGYRDNLQPQTQPTLDYTTQLGYHGSDQSQQPGGYHGNQTQPTTSQLGYRAHNIGRPMMATMKEDPPPLPSCQFSNPPPPSGHPGVTWNVDGIGGTPIPYHLPQQQVQQQQQFQQQQQQQQELQQQQFQQQQLQQQQQQELQQQQFQQQQQLQQQQFQQQQQQQFQQLGHQQLGHQQLGQGVQQYQPQDTGLLPSLSGNFAGQQPLHHLTASLPQTTSSHSSACAFPTQPSVVPPLQHLSRPLQHGEASFNPPQAPPPLLLQSSVGGVSSVPLQPPPPPPQQQYGVTPPAAPLPNGRPSVPQGLVAAVTHQPSYHHHQQQQLQQQQPSCSGQVNLPSQQQQSHSYIPLPNRQSSTVQQQASYPNNIYPSGPANNSGTATQNTMFIGLDTMATESLSQVAGQNLVNLTGEDLQILEFIDQMDTTGNSLKQAPPHLSHMQQH